MTPVFDNQETWSVTPPSWRFDIAIEQDLIEEVARVYGYDNIASDAAKAPQVPRGASERQIGVERISQLLVDRGYQEAITYSFTDPNIQQALFPNEAALALANPISAELGVMRLSLWPGLVQALATNQRRQQSRVRLFEIGRKFSSDGKQETNVVAGVAAGLAIPKQWGTESRAVDFYDVKDDVEGLLQLTGFAGGFTFEAAEHPALHPGQSACIRRHGQSVGWIGALHPRLVNALDLSYSAVVFELELGASFVAQVPEYQEISRFPSVRRDLALIVTETLRYQTLAEAVGDAAGPLLKELTAFDVYHGPGVEKGKKSIALGLVLQDTSRTLTDAEVDAAVARVVDHLAQRLDARLRDK